jgi:hypothetical protein
MAASSDQAGYQKSSKCQITFGYSLSSKDLVVLAADKDMEETLLGLLRRERSLGIRKISFAIYRHPGRDSSCRTNGASFLRSFCNQFSHAVLIFDHDGSGAEATAAEQLEEDLESQLERNGWQDRAAVIVIEPELESWVWSDSTEVDQVVGWGGRIPDLRRWLVDVGFLPTTSVKPKQPKEAFRQALRHVRKQPSAALFKQLALRVSFRRCEDRAFQKLVAKLQEWFPEN